MWVGCEMDLLSFPTQQNTVPRALRYFHPAKAAFLSRGSWVSMKVLALAKCGTKNGTCATPRCIDRRRRQRFVRFLPFGTVMLHTHTYCHTQLTEDGSSRLLLHTGVVGSHASIGVEFWGVILTSTRSIKCLAFFPLPIPSSVVGSVVRFNFVA